MKHKRSIRTLGRKAHHREQLMKNLCSSLLKHGSVTTTATKAGELRRYIEPLITEAKKELTLSRRRTLLAAVGDSDQLPALVELAQTHIKRPGGYVRITKLPIKRTDGAPVARIDVLAE